MLMPNCSLKNPKLNFRSNLISCKAKMLESIYGLWWNSEFVDTKVESVKSGIFLPSVSGSSFDRNSKSISKSLLNVFFWLFVKNFSDWHGHHSSWNSWILEQLLGLHSYAYFRSSSNKSDLSVFRSLANDISSLGTLILFTGFTNIGESLSTQCNKGWSFHWLHRDFPALSSLDSITRSHCVKIWHCPETS